MHKLTEKHWLSCLHKHYSVVSSSITKHSSPRAKSSTILVRLITAAGIRRQLSKHASMHICTISGGRAAIGARRVHVPSPLKWLCLHRVVELCGHTCAGGREGRGSQAREERWEVVAPRDVTISANRAALLETPQTALAQLIGQPAVRNR